MNPTVLVVLGTRPEAIKLAPVVHALRADTLLDVRVCSTGQHREMLRNILPVFDIEPDDDLDLMRPNQSPAGVAAAAMAGLDAVLTQRRPSLVVVQGDTTSAFAAALTGFYHGVPVAHVEAGLRTGDLRAPWPEEANRVLTTRISDFHFAPTRHALHNLLQEGVPVDRILVTGNTVVDALMFAVRKLSTSRVEHSTILPDALMADPSQRVVLITGHRRESFGRSLLAICEAIRELAGLFPEVLFVYPVHLNPRVREAVDRVLGSGRGTNVLLLDPLPYLDFVALMQRACLILSDSGGIQEEAPTLGVPVLVLRDRTERSEAVSSGAALLVGTEANGIVAAASRLLSDEQARRRMPRLPNPFGDGLASRRIAAAISSVLRGLGMGARAQEFAQEEVSNRTA